MLPNCQKFKKTCSYPYPYYIFSIFLQLHKTFNTYHIITNETMPCNRHYIGYIMIYIRSLKRKLFFSRKSTYPYRASIFSFFILIFNMIKLFSFYFITKNEHCIMNSIHKPLLLQQLYVYIPFFYFNFQYLQGQEYMKKKEVLKLFGTFYD